MIPYDDLVAALATWRARQGLSAPQPGGTPAPLANAPRRTPATPQPAVRVAAPAAPPRPATPAPAAASPRPAAPPPRAPSELDDFDEGERALALDLQYEASDDDYVGVTVDSGEATAIGGAPEPPDALRSRPGKRPPDR